MSIIFINVQNYTQEKLTKHHYKILTSAQSYMQDTYYTILKDPKWLKVFQV